ncbi:Hypothetical predicted protein [Octopus vulgaris]|uniref:Uncharacterized protein n=1 Tax=Octopus vulgaris TaxID=6645 RepID=A0AA36AQI0_OCTVU|nr:Hypothetical predicted protein [Octopus vulgaris]
MSSSDDDSDYEASLGGLDTSDESESSSEEFYSSEETEDEDEEFSELRELCAPEHLANPTAPYSTPLPETNSDSPAAKSNGAR